MRKFAFLLMAVSILLSCTNSKDSPVDASANEQIVKQYFEHFNNHEWSKMADMYADSADFKDPSMGEGILKQTKAQIIDKYTSLTKTFPDLHDQIVQVYPSGDKHIIVEFISSGTAPDNSRFEMPICVIFTIENGRITKDFTYFDNFDDESM